MLSLFNYPIENFSNDTLDLQKIGKITHCAELLFGDGEEGGIVCNLRPPAEKTKIT